MESIWQRERDSRHKRIVPKGEKVSVERVSICISICCMKTGVGCVFMITGDRNVKAEVLTQE